MPQSTKKSRRFWVAAIAVVIIGYLIITRADEGETPSEPLDATSSVEIDEQISSTTINADFLKDYTNFEDCNKGWSEPSPDFTEPIGCITIIFNCSRFRELKLSFSQTKQDITDGLAVAEDLTIPIQNFVNESKLWIEVPERDSIRVAFDEMTVSLRRLRVALLTGDSDSVSKWGSASDPLMSRVESICQTVPQQNTSGS